MRADSKLIEWLLYDSEVTTYSIQKDSELSKSTISDLRTKKTKLDRITFKNACSLSEYAERLIDGKVKPSYRSDVTDLSDRRGKHPTVGYDQLEEKLFAINDSVAKYDSTI